MGYRHGRQVTLDHCLNAVRSGVPFDVFYAGESLMIWTENTLHDHTRRADAPVPMDDAE